MYGRFPSAISYDKDVTTLKVAVFWRSVALKTCNSKRRSPLNPVRDAEPDRKTKSDRLKENLILKKIR